jgi:hypothetical protein
MDASSFMFWDIAFVGQLKVTLSPALALNRTSGWLVAAIDGERGTRPGPPRCGARDQREIQDD